MTETIAMPRRAANKIRVRKALMRAAAARFAQNGIAGTTMDEIAAQAEVSRATLFNYFPGKADIVAALVETMDQRFAESIAAHADLDLPVADRVIAMFRNSGRELQIDYPELRPLVGISAQGWGETIGSMRYSRLQRSFLGLVHDVPEPERHTVADILAGTYVGIVHSWRFEDQFPLEQRLEEAARFVTRALR